MNVDMDGDYITDQPTYINANMLEKSFSDAQLDFLKENLSETHYESLIFTTENGCLSINEEGEKKTISGIVPTMGGYDYSVEILNGEIIKVSFSDKIIYSFDN